RSPRALKAFPRVPGRSSIRIVNSFVTGMMGTLLQVCMFPRTQGAFLANRRARLFDVAKLYCRVSAIARIGQNSTEKWKVEKWQMLMIRKNQAILRMSRTFTVATTVSYFPLSGAPFFLSPTLKTYLRSGALL